MADRALSHQLDHFTSTVTLARKGEEVPVSYQLAGTGARCLAGLFDLLIQGLLFAALAWAALRFRPDLFPRESWPWAVPVGFVELHVIYHMLCEAISRGSSPGMRAVGIRLISTDGSRPRPWRIVLRSLCRIPGILTGYVVSFWLINLGRDRQGAGDRIAGTMVIYREPLKDQMAQSHVPDSLYSTSEAGYLLQAWMERNSRMDTDSQNASALDLAAYLHSTYDPDARDLPEPAVYLRNLFEKEMAEHPAPGTAVKSE